MAGLPRVDENAVLEGDFTLMQDGRLKLSYLEDDTGLIAGDQVTTSGLGMVYPAGLLVGTVESLHTEANGQDQYAVIQSRRRSGQRPVRVYHQRIWYRRVIGRSPARWMLCREGGLSPFPIKIR